MRKMIITTALALLVVASFGEASRGALPKARPEDAGMSSNQLALLDGILNAAVARKDFPGAVLLVARHGKVVYRKAFGDSQRVPDRRPMTADMIFDLASLTKPVATATSIMLLVERGEIRLWDRVSVFVPGFSIWHGEKGLPGEETRLFHLLTHTSGLPPYTDAKEAAEKLGDPCATADLVGLIAALPKESAVATEFVYSCLNYITLAHIVHKVTGKTVAEFAGETIFRPLGMTRTFFRPPEAFLGLCVPTEVVDGKPLRGIVHDPLARLQGGVSGNAGLFSTADDLAVFAEMLLNGGELSGVRVLSPLSVERMTEIYPKLGRAGRGLGWDVDTDYATVRGDLFGPRSYGHSGYTGTSIWIDPETRTTVVFLTNRVHPDDKGDIIALRSKVANVVAAAVRGK
jgi:CubicO group peptidase (beta-lactamase class C family)